MKYVAVIDTNVIISALLSKDSNPGKIISYIEQGIITPVYDSSILDEYIEVLEREKFPFTKDEIKTIVKLFKTKGFMLNQTQTSELFKDQSDIKFYQIVLTANKIQLSYLVTGNLKDFPKKIYVVNPTQMVNIIESK